MAAKKKAAPEVGSPPPPLPSGSSLLDELAEIERLAREPATAFAATQRRASLTERAIDPAEAAELLSRIGFDLGHLPENFDSSTAPSLAERKRWDAARLDVVMARNARQGTLTTLFAIVARDPLRQERALAALPGSPPFRDQVAAALVSTPSPAVLHFAQRHVLDLRPTERALAMIAAGAILRAGGRQSLELLGPALSRVDLQSLDALEHARAIIDAGRPYWASADPGFRPILAELAELARTPFDASHGDVGRARLHLGNAAAAALALMSGATPSVAAPAHPQSMSRPASSRAPVGLESLTTPAAREAALDALGRWFVEAVADAGADDDAARAAMEAAIASFYDIRESADQPRGEYAGHFFRVDAVGLDATQRPIPWDELRARVGEERAEELAEVFDEAEAAVE